MAPEMAASAKWSTKTDMYALGVIMWEIFTGAYPFSQMSYDRIVEAVVNRDARPDDGHMAKAKVSTKHQELIARLWHKDPTQRPSADLFVSLVNSKK